jgi:MFS family permease
MTMPQQLSSDYVVTDGSMLVPGLSPSAAHADASRSRLTRVALATMIGSGIEAFDFLMFGTAAALVFNKSFFPNFDPTAAALAAFATFATGLFARPIGGLLFGHFGDRFGRKAMLMLSLMGMGFATVLIGLTPSYQMIGLWAAVLLVVLRIVQGLSFGGEMGGAMIMAVEHAPDRYKSFFGSLPQMGAPIGLLLSTSAFAAVSGLPEQAFASWGWRLPFIGSIVLVIIGYFVRRNVDESPEFVEFERKQKVVRLPALEVVRRHSKPLLLTIGGKLAEVTLFYFIVVFMLSYAVRQQIVTRSDGLEAIMIGAAVQLAAIPICGWLGDRIGQKLLYCVGGGLLAVLAVPALAAIGGGSAIGLKIAIVAGLRLIYPLMYGPQASLFSVQFPATLRCSGLSLGIQIAAAIGGGLAPIVAAALLEVSGSLVPIGVYLAGLGVIAAACALLARSPAAIGRTAMQP